MIIPKGAPGSGLALALIVGLIFTAGRDISTLQAYITGCLLAFGILSLITDPD